MGLPNCPNKFHSSPVFTASDRLARRSSTGVFPSGSTPRGMILCYQRNLMERIARKHPIRKVGGFFGECFQLKDTGGRVGIMGNFGIGAPVAVVLLEELISCGVHQFISLGIAGSLQDGFQAGDLVICEQAIRDEGTSYHYLEPQKYALADLQLTEQMKQALENAGQHYQSGPSWTTDAPYRETQVEVEHYRQEGVITVEMEAAALFAAGQALGVQVGAAFSISDSLGKFIHDSPNRPAGLRPSPPQRLFNLDLQRTMQGLETLTSAAIQVLATSEAYASGNRRHSK